MTTNEWKLSFRCDTSKTVNGVTTEYYILEGVLLGQKTGEESIFFLYDENGSAYGFLLKNGTTDASYYYEFNLQGDVTGIIDASGTKVVEYTYGAWGDILSVTGTMAGTIGQKNPLRYRGYYYDSETGFYYLSSRYYDAEICRFLNADTTNILTATPMALTDKNLFAYCDNNPVVRVDRSGEFWDYILDIGFLAWSIIDVINDPSDWKNWAALAVDIVFAVIPFVPSWVGQIIKVGNKVDNAVDIANAINKVDNIQDATKVTMIGRNMDRVKDTADIIGVTDNLYDTWKGYDQGAKGIKKFCHNGISMAHNGAWLFGKLRNGYTVIDIGVSTVHTGKGLWYGTERFVLSAWQTRNVWKFPINYNY